MRVLPTSFQRLSSIEAYNAREAASRVVRTLHQNQVWLWARPKRQPLSWASRFKNSITSSHEGGTDTTATPLAQFIVPPSYGPSIVMRLLVRYTGGNGADAVRVFAYSDSALTMISASSSSAAGTLTLDVPILGGDQIDRINVYLAADGGGAAVVNSISGLFVPRTDAQLALSATATWQPLSQAWAVADRPLASCVLKTLIDATHTQWNRHQTGGCARWLGAISTASSSAVKLGDYDAYVPPLVTAIEVWYYVRATAGTSTIRLDIDGTTRDTQTFAGVNWQWIGPYTVSVGLSTNAANLFSVYASSGAESGGTTYLGAVMIQEKELTPTQLSLPGADTIPAAFAPMDTDYLAMQRPISAGANARTKVVGLSTLIANTIWLMARRRRTLVADYRVKQAYVTAPYTTGTACETDPVAHAAHSLVPGDISGGTLVGAGVWSTSTGASRLSVVASLAVSVAKSTDAAEVDRLIAQADDGAEVLATDVRAYEESTADANASAVTFIPGVGYLGGPLSRMHRRGLGWYVNPGTTTTREFDDDGLLVSLPVKTITSAGDRHLYLSGLQASAANGTALRCHGCLAMEAPLDQAALDAL